MIKFDKEHKCENPKDLEKEEAEAYINFLSAEKDRHFSNITECWRQLDLIAMYPTNKECDRATTALWRSAVKRHKKDIEGIDILVSTLKGFYGI